MVELTDSGATQDRQKMNIRDVAANGVDSRVTEFFGGSIAAKKTNKIGRIAATNSVAANPFGRNFALTGLRTRIGLVSGMEAWLLCGLVIAIASIGKFGGSFAAVRLNGLSWRNASALGVLMNTRGMAELIVLNIGLQIRVINPRVFAMLVIMSLVTTLATTPLLYLVRGRGEAPPADDSGDSRRALHQQVELHRHALLQSLEPKG